MLLGILTFDGDNEAVVLYPLVLGGVSIVASIIGTFAVKSAAGNVERALYQGLVLSGVLAALFFLPVTLWMMDDLTFATGDARGARRVGHLPVRADRPGHHRGAVRHHGLLHVHALLAREVDGGGVRHRPRDEHHPGPRPGPPGDRAARPRHRARHLHLQRAGRHLRDRRGRHGAALAHGPHRRARRLRPHHRQRGRHRRDGRDARIRARRHRPARRGRQHHQGRDQGLRDRLRRARRARAVRGVQDRAGGRARAARSSSRSTIPTC